VRAFFCLSFILILSQSAFAKLEDWGVWGEGSGSFVSDVGHREKGSLWLSTDFGETQTAHYHWENLTPGIYKVSVFVKASNVREGKDNTSFWHFHDGGSGTESTFYDLHGSYDWRKIEYHLKVKKNDLLVWFRLKSPGQVWIDDFEIQKVQSFNPKIDISAARPARPENSDVKEALFKKYLESSIPLEPFSIIANASGKKMGSLLTQKYYNFKTETILNGNWSKFDRIEMDVYNSKDDLLEFYLTLTDNQTTNYWSQLNHKTHLAPGWNHLSFSLNQYVGERGSHRFNRPINLQGIKKFFIVADPDSKKASTKLFIDKIRLISIPYPEIPKGMMAIDFTSSKDKSHNGFKKISTQSPEFEQPNFWRLEDSLYASETLRYSIGILGGKLHIKLPNGKYKIQILSDKLGYWDVPFWRMRKFFINNRLVFNETRNHSGDYLKDYLMFENIVPSSTDHPYDLYLKKVFKPFETNITVTNNSLDFEFDADPSGISLNRLFIWKTADEASARRYLEELSKRDKLEFNWMSRPILKPKAQEQSSKIISVVEPDLFLGPSDNRISSNEELLFFGGSGERPSQLLQLRAAKEEKISWTISELKNKDGIVLPGHLLKFSEVIFQYVSPDLNHETYMVVGKYLKQLELSSMDLKPQTQFLWIHLPITKMIAPGTYEGKLSFALKGDNHDIPLRISIMPYSLPKVDFPVGFFGLDPIPHTYFNSPDVPDMRKRYRSEALRMLGDAGFTTFSGLPEVQLTTQNGQISLKMTELDDLFKEAKEYGFGNVVFSYGGKFPESLLDETQKPYDWDSQKYHFKLGEVLKAHLENPSWPSIVHTFSDEAGGYSDKIAEDIKKAEWLKGAYSFLPLGGFSSMKSSDANPLNKFFDYGFFSKVESGIAKRITESGKRWGSYNGAPGNLNDPRFAFGPGLYLGRESGLSHYLEWHATGFNNYPYYDLDGRESDVSMFLPTSGGKLHPAIRFEFSVQGLNSYRKLVLLKKLIEEKKGKEASLSSARKWLYTLTNPNDFFNKDDFLLGRNYNFKKFEAGLNANLASLLE
jgi:hypothetical protein